MKKSIKNEAVVCLYCGAPTIFGDKSDTKQVKLKEQISSKLIYKKLRKDYKKKDLLWVKDADWFGPLEIEIDAISFAGSEDWDACKKKGQAVVEKFSKLLSDKGFPNVKPIILAGTQDGKLTIVNGRHRVIAAQKIGVPILAYIAYLNNITIPYIQTKHDEHIDADE